MEAGELEILTFLPPSLRKKKIGDMNLDEFMDCLAKARCVKNMMREIIQNGMAGAFGGAEE